MRKLHTEEAKQSQGCLHKTEQPRRADSECRAGVPWDHAHERKHPSPHLAHQLGWWARARDPHQSTCAYMCKAAAAGGQIQTGPVSIASKGQAQLPEIVKSSE